MILNIKPKDSISTVEKDLSLFLRVLSIQKVELFRWEHIKRAFNCGNSILQIFTYRKITF